MDIVTIIIPFIIGCLVLVCVMRYRTSRKITIQLKDEDTERVIRTGTGRSYGSAALDLCFKLYSSAPSTRMNGIQERIDSIDKVINEYRGKMKAADLQTCESYRDQLDRHLNDLKRQAEDRKRNAETERKKLQEEKEQIRKITAERKQKEREQAWIKKAAQMSEHKRHISAQRRLMTDSIRYDVMHRDGFRCVLCGASPKNDPNIILHVDHILPLAKGGKTEMSNLRTLCERCNLGKRDKLESGTAAPSDRSNEPARKSGQAKRKTSSSASSKKSKPVPENADILCFLRNEGVSYIDNRASGGALWVIGGHELDVIMAKVERKGYTFVFSEKGGRATKGQAAWWYKAV